jgi:hypothetical protein
MSDKKRPRTVGSSVPLVDRTPFQALSGVKREPVPGRPGRLRLADGGVDLPRSKPFTLGEPGTADTTRPNPNRSACEESRIHGFSSTGQFMLPIQPRTPIFLRRVCTTCPPRPHEHSSIAALRLERLAAPDRRAGWCRR